MIYVLIWWLIIQALGWLALPLTLWIFRWLPERGYALSKTFGLLLVSYILWLGASTRFLNNNLGGILAAILILAAISTWIYYRRFPTVGFSLADFLRQNKRMILVVEVLFTLAFIAWAILRAYAPDKIMNAGGEKFMEIAFLNAILNSQHFPPLDPWLSGFAISYYYFGYVMMALVTKLSGAPSGIGFELYDALLFALTLTGAFSVVYNLVAGALRRKPEISANHASIQPVMYGLVGALFTGVMGNLEGLLEALHSRGVVAEKFWQWINIPDLAAAFVNKSWYPGHTGGWWWWRGSRVIQDLDLANRPMGISPITEFPFFSFLLGDNHPHVLALPFVLLAIGLALNILLRQIHQSAAAAKQSASVAQTADQRWWNPARYALENDWLLFGGAALILGGLAFLNTWDFPIYLGLCVLAYVLGTYLHAKQVDRLLLLRTLVLGIGLMAAAVLFYLFFYIGFGSQAGGILPYIFPPTRLPQYLVMFGPFVFILGSFLLVYLLAPTSAAPRSAVLRAGLGWWLNLILIALALEFIVIAVGALSPAGSQLIQQTLSNPELESLLGGNTFGEVMRAIFSSRLASPWLFLFLSALIALCLVNALWKLPRQTAADDPAHPETLFVFLLIFVGLALTWSVEFFYLRDHFNMRMNTIFKFFYQGWVMMGCASAYALWWMLNPGAKKVASVARYAIFGGAIALILLGMIYPLMASYSRVNGFGGDPNLDGSSPVAAQNPDDWAAIEWLRANNDVSQHAPTLLEAPGGSYTYEGRISAFTGFPAVLGWAVHESQWRGNYDEQGKREPDIITIYTTSDTTLMLELLKKWEVDYVIFGATEQRYIQQKCQEENRRCNLNSAMRKFDLFLKPVFQQGQMTIYAVP